MEAVAQLIEALRTQPAVLALIVTCMALIGYLYYQGMAFEASRSANVASVLKMQADMSRLISECVRTPTP